MLVSFGVQNYRSFAARQTLSMAAGTSARQQERFSFASGNSLAPDLLRSVCLFGPNGAGKSALVQALHFFQKFVISSAKDSQEGEKIEISSFRFDDAWRGKPTEMEATFIFDGAYYQYGFAVD
ncbi:MAG: AAA family ATPase, partial [Alphaproteobacteria bacterium]|nr:AAA family ATPase [Alphaproteobacteria bacterium]